MTRGTKVSQARWLALLAPGVLLAGAYTSQYVGGLYPCEMCLWQRWPHWAALALAALAFVPQLPARLLVALAAGGILTSGLIGGFHAGVEYGWWEGITSCTASAGAAAPGQSALDAIMNAPLVRCDEPAFTLAGISLAGFNFLFSTVAGLAIFRLLMERTR